VWDFYVFVLALIRNIVSSDVHADGTTKNILSVFDRAGIDAACPEGVLWTHLDFHDWVGLPRTPDEDPSGMSEDHGNGSMDALFQDIRVQKFLLGQGGNVKGTLEKLGVSLVTAVIDGQHSFSLHVAVVHKDEVSALWKRYKELHPDDLKETSAAVEARVTLTERAPTEGPEPRVFEKSIEVVDVQVTGTSWDSLRMAIVSKIELDYPEVLPCATPAQHYLYTTFTPPCLSVAEYSCALLLASTLFLPPFPPLLLRLLLLLLIVIVYPILVFLLLIFVLLPSPPPPPLPLTHPCAHYHCTD
jgi:hypothetical protein